MRVKELFVHPVKSLGGISVSQVQIDEYGIHNDRVYMVTIPTDEPGRSKMLTQREFAPMSRIMAEISDTGVKLRHCDGGIAIILPLDTHLAQVAAKCVATTVNIWGDDTQAYDVGEITGFKSWWQQVFPDSKYTNASLVVPVSTGRRSVARFISEEHAEDLGREIRNSFQDRFPGHLLGTASLDELNGRLQEESNGMAHRVNARNFRPNIVAETEEPYEEDFWEIFKTGEITWYTSQLCPRCPIPTIDTQTGEVSKLRQPTKTMARYRKVEPRDLSHPSFGISITNKERTGTVRVGDTIEVLQNAARY